MPIGRVGDCPLGGSRTAPRTGRVFHFSLENRLGYTDLSPDVPISNKCVVERAGVRLYCSSRFQPKRSLYDDSGIRRECLRGWGGVLCPASQAGRSAPPLGLVG